MVQWVQRTGGQHPWMVDMRWFANEHLCGATLIHPEWVLTAGHCAITAWDENMMLVANSIANGNGFGPKRGRAAVRHGVLPTRLRRDQWTDLALIHLSTPANHEYPYRSGTLPMGPLPGTGLPAQVLRWGVADTVTLFENRHAPGGRCGALRLRHLCVPVRQCAVRLLRSQWDTGPDLCGLLRWSAGLRFRQCGQRWTADGPKWRHVQVWCTAAKNC